MSAASVSTRRSLLVPEVVQTSKMDCGVATLKCLLDGFGIPASYGRLREACQTDVDGTSIDALEEIAQQLGLDADQEIFPVDYLLLSEAKIEPAIVVVRLPNGFTHFAVLWRRHGRLVQVMDPASGRRWMTRDEFVNNVYVHTSPILAVAWRKWAGSDRFLRTFRQRLKDLKLSASTSEALVERATSDKEWRGLATLDAATRMVTAIVRARGLAAGRQAGRVLQLLFEQALEEPAGSYQTIPQSYWLVRPYSTGSGKEENLLMRGAVLVRVRGRRRKKSLESKDVAEQADSSALCPELVAALNEKPKRAGRELVKMLAADGLLSPGAICLGLAVAATGGVLEAVLFRGLLDLHRQLNLVEQRFAAIIALLVFITAILFIELSTASGLYRLGRRLEIRLRLAFLEKIPRLGDKYFQSRPTSDMAERSHSVHSIRMLPGLGGQLIRAVMELTVTVCGIIWLDPSSAPLAILAATLAIALPVLLQKPIAERDLRLRSFAGSLTCFYLDALLGLTTVLTHGAEKAIRREHEGMLVDWARAGSALQRAVVSTEGIQSLLSLGLVVLLVLNYLGRASDAGGVLLLMYWTLNLPLLGQEIALLSRQYPSFRNVTLRLLEPLGAPEDAYAEGAAVEMKAAPQRVVKGVAIQLERLSVRAAGHTILEDVDLAVEAGSHVAIVGPSGAGKSSLVGLLLGWHRPASGQALVDGAPLDADCLNELRRVTAWVDPSVQLWNRSFYENLHYGAPENPTVPLGQVIEEADLRLVLENLPETLQTPLGEGGALLSGGEGQRVRFGRAVLRSRARLVILDEPFRGLTRRKRSEFLERARRMWRDATIICISHDVSETTAFERVLVMEGGRIVEDGAPCELLQRAESRYGKLLEAEETVLQSLWAGADWRRLHLERGRLVQRDNGFKQDGQNEQDKREELASS
ncbi:MAG TPA: ATP-binding cassette domain-containing protein [Pyrinomonadaceae bacterium]|nr:ATP-binding cassette domain-containing protein [Pyrinomonadaceae bacterium]